jgi:hypothetical protein
MSIVEIRSPHCFDAIEQIAWQPARWRVTIILNEFDCAEQFLTHRKC